MPSPLLFLSTENSEERTIQQQTLLFNPIHHASGVFEFDFTNRTALNFDILVSTNATLPSTNWTNLGPAASLGAGPYRFTDGGATGQPRRFYLLREQYRAVSLAPAGRNIYSYGIMKPEAPSERHGNEHALRWGLFVVWVRWL